MSCPPLTPQPPRMEDMDPIEWSAAGEPPPDAAEWTGRRVYKLAVISEPRRAGKSYWRKRAEDAEGRLDVVREWLDSRGVDVGERDDEYMDGYRAAQRHAIQDAAALRAAIEDAR